MQVWEASRPSASARTDASGFTCISACTAELTRIARADEQPRLHELIREGATPEDHSLAWLSLANIRLVLARRRYAPRP